MDGRERQGAEGMRAALWLLAAGVALRLAWLGAVRAMGFLDLGEATHAAMAFARGGTIADGFFPGQGPTAHLMPVTVTLAAAAFRAFGADSAAANLLLAAWALAQMAAAFLLHRLLFARIGLSRAALLGGMAILCLVPAHVVQETADFRYWETGLAACLAALNLLLIADLDSRAQVPLQPLLLGAALSAATFFTSPTTGVAVDACWAVFALRRLPFGQVLRFAGAAAAALALLVGPWMLRNAMVMGEPIALRSNFGLEFAIANHPAALGDGQPLAVLRARMAAIHPYANPGAAARLRAAGGEIAYSRQLGAESGRWIAAHPLDFARLALRHYRQFYLPDRWQGALTNWQDWNGPRIDAIRLVSLLGLLGLGLGLALRRRFYGMLALYVALAGLPYALVQPIPRYSYLLWPLLAFLAARLPGDLAAAVRRLRGREGGSISLR